MTDSAAIYDVLVEECGAPEAGREDFIRYWPCGEWRFGGALGFGGKLHCRSSMTVDGMTHYSDEVFVSCYREDETARRRAMIERANERLGPIWGETDVTERTVDDDT